LWNDGGNQLKREMPEFRTKHSISARKMPIEIQGRSMVLCIGDLVKQKAAAADTQYTCPMHPEIVRDEPGACPICGMALVLFAPDELVMN
jgi:hypothetical protein